MGKRGPKPGGDPARLAVAEPLWLAGDREGAVAAAGLSQATLYRRWGPPGASAPSAPTPTPPQPPASQVLVPVARRPQVRQAEPAPAEPPMVASPLPLADADTLATTTRVLHALVYAFERAATTRELGVLADKVAAQVKVVEAILRSRPKPPERDEVVVALKELDRDAILKLEEHLERAEKTVPLREVQ